MHGPKLDQPKWMAIFSHSLLAKEGRPGIEEPD
jgi:hypothetical protein